MINLLKQIPAREYGLIFWLTVAAVAIPVWAIWQQYRVINIEAGAEDDCAYYYGAYALDEVVGMTDKNGGHYVICQYR